MNLVLHVDQETIWLVTMTAAATALVAAFTILMTVLDPPYEPTHT